MFIEIWKDIKGYENLYQVSNMGKIKSLGNGSSSQSKHRIMKLCFSTKGYLMVGLCKNGDKKTFKVHRLVAEAFLPNPDNLPQVNHKDEDKTNNSVDNLEWCDTDYNLHYGSRLNRISCSNTNNIKLSKSVIALKDNKVCMYFPSTMEAKRMGFHQANVYLCCIGERYTHKGYEWKYLDDYLADWLEAFQDECMKKEKVA